MLFAPPYDYTLKPPQWAGPEIMEDNVKRAHGRRGLPHPVLRMPMWEGCGNTTYGLDGGGFFGMLLGGALFQDDGIFCDTTNDYISIADPNAALTPSEITIIARIIPSASIIDNDRIFQKKTIWNDPNGWSLEYKLDQTWVVVGSGNTISRSNISLWDMNTEVEIAVSINSAGNVKFYKNGTFHSNGSAAVEPITTNTVPLLLNAYTGPANFAGQLFKHVSIYGSVLTWEIGLIYEQPYFDLYPEPIPFYSIPAAAPGGLAIPGFFGSTLKPVLPLFKDVNL